jgi:hypothetical protein
LTATLRWCARLVPLAAAARVAASFAAAAAAIAATEALLYDARHLVGWWRARRDGWRAALAAAATLPQLALLLHEMSEACVRDKVGTPYTLPEST